MGFELAQVIAELGQGVFLGAELVSGKDGLPGLGGSAIRRVEYPGGEGLA